MVNGLVTSCGSDENARPTTYLGAERQKRDVAEMNRARDAIQVVARRPELVAVRHAVQSEGIPPESTTC